MKNPIFLGAVVMVALVLSIAVTPVIGIFIAIVYMSTYFTLYQEHAQLKVMRTFAHARGLEFKRTDRAEYYRANLFDKGRDQKIKNLISDTHDSNKIQMFNYTFVTGSGKSKVTHRFTVGEIEIVKTRFPHILLQSRSMRMSFKDVGATHINIGNEFEDTFRLYCETKYEIEVLQIFTDDLLRLLKASGAHLSVEFCGNKIYIFDDRYMNKQEELQGLHTLLQSIVNHSGPLLHRLHDDFEAMHLFSKNNPL